MRRRGDAGGVGIGRKRFFFEKKNQKTFEYGYAPDCERTNESLLLVFFRKEDLCFLGGPP
jgi:hypothetical protein